MATLVGTQKDIAKLLNELIELDLDAVEAYEEAIARLEDKNDTAQLGEFKGDHERHVRELQPLVTELGEEPARGPDFKRILTKGKVVLGSIAGDRMILLAMKTNEQDTNTAYERAVNRSDIPGHVRDVLVRNREDERRHLAYVEKRLAEYEAQDKSAAAADKAEEPTPVTKPEGGEPAGVHR